MNTHLHQRAQDYLRKLCIEIDNRRVGSQGNHEATTFFAMTAASFGFTVEYSLFDCIDWCQEGVDLTIEGVAFAAFASPYSLGVKVRAPLAVVDTIEALEAADLARKIVLLQGAITAE